MQAVKEISIAAWVHKQTKCSQIFLVQLPEETFHVDGAQTIDIFILWAVVLISVCWFIYM